MSSSDTGPPGQVPPVPSERQQNERVFDELDQNQRDNYARRPYRNSSAVSNWLVAILLILVVAMLLRFTNGGRDLIYGPGAEPRAITPRGDLAEDEKSTIALFQEASPSVVYITTSAHRPIVENLPIYENVPKGSGSGFIWDKQGHIVTNMHVLQGASGAEVTLQNQKRYPASLVGRAPEYDLAVLKIDAPPQELKPLAIGTSDDLQEGQKAFAIGFPFGLDHTLTSGLIGGLNREFRSKSGDSMIKKVIQTDAAINPGNSGGPLLDSAGRLIGVNSAIYSDTGNFAGIGFAIPVNTVNEVVPDLIDDGILSRPGLGISLIQDNAVRYLAMRKLVPRRGVMFADVYDGTAADEAGLIPIDVPPRITSEGHIVGDLIISLGGKDIQSNRELLDQLKEYKVGDLVELVYLRDGEEHKVEVELKQAL